MIDLGEFNSRLKDFYDLYKFISKCDKIVLKEAIKNTFKRRKTIATKNYPIFQEKFYADQHRLKQWSIFLEKNKLGKIDLKDVSNLILSELYPIYKEI